jgi:hypothetical protein
VTSAGSSLWTSLHGRLGPASLTRSLSHPEGGGQLTNDAESYWRGRWALAGDVNLCYGRLPCDTAVEIEMTSRVRD